MPQLEFTLWMLNFMTNWFILILVFLYIKGDSTTPSQTSWETSQQACETKNNKKWPW